MVWVSTSLPASGRKRERWSFGSSSQPASHLLVRRPELKPGPEPGDPLGSALLRACSFSSLKGFLLRAGLGQSSVTFAVWRPQQCLPARLLQAHYFCFADAALLSDSGRACAGSRGTSQRHGGPRLPRRLHCGCRQSSDVALRWGFSAAAVPGFFATVMLASTCT